MSDVLDKKMMESIDSYSSRVVTLNNFVEHVRLRPGMWIGPRHARGLLNMIREVFQNSIDQLVDPTSPCDIITVSYNAITNVTIIEDNGLGIPFNDIVRIFNQERTSKNYVKKPYEYSSGLNGVGAKVTNALSQYFIVESYHYSGKAKRAEFHDGILIGDVEDIPNTDKKQGTKIEFRPSYEIMGDIDLPADAVLHLIRLILSLTPLGSRIDYTHTESNGSIYHELMVNEDGILTDLISKMKSPIIKPIIVHQDNGTMKLDIAFCWDSDALKESEIENITAFSNMCPTSKGTHVEGFISGVTQWFTKYMNNIFLGQKSKLNVISADIRIGLCAMISVAHLEPDFTGQSKDELSNPDMKPFVISNIQIGLDEWSKSSPNDLQRLCKFFKEIAEIRQKSDNEKVKLSKTISTNVLTGMPDKFVKPTSNAKGAEYEFIIVEGDSAGGTAKSGRMNALQGILPIRGKIINPFTCSFQRLMENEEVCAIITIITNGELKGNITLTQLRNYPLEKIKWKKIIFMADADPDGSHIAALLIRLFITIFPQLVADGRIFRALPPLFGISVSKKMKYFTEYIDFIKFRQKVFNEKYSVCNINNEKYSNAKILNILMENDEYTFEVNKIANRYAINPLVLEIIVLSFMKNETLKEMKYHLNEKFRFLDVKQDKNKIITVEGLVEDKYNIFFVTEKFSNETKNIQEYLNPAIALNYTHFIINNSVMSLYQMMNIFENISLGSLQRYKGLGEMDATKLGESTLLPDSNRILYQYTTDNVMEEIKTIRVYESDKKKFLSMLGNVKRSDLMA